MSFWCMFFLARSPWSYMKHPILFMLPQAPTACHIRRSMQEHEGAIACCIRTPRAQDFHSPMDRFKCQVSTSMCMWKCWLVQDVCLLTRQSLITFIEPRVWGFHELVGGFKHQQIAFRCKYWDLFVTYQSAITHQVLGSFPKQTIQGQVWDLNPPLWTVGISGHFHSLLWVASHGTWDVAWGLVGNVERGKLGAWAILKRCLHHGP